MFIVDFDDTLFDTQAFKQERLVALRHLGVSDELYWETYKRAYNDEDGNVTYTNERHAAAFAGTDIDQNKVLEALSDISKNRAQEFLFRDAVQFLKKLRVHNQPIILLSLGASSFQHAKVSGTNIDQHVDRVVIVDSAKEHGIADQLSGVLSEKVWLINDKIDETLRLIRLFPVMNAVLKRGPFVSEDAYKKIHVPYFDSLTDIATYVTKHV